MKKILFILLPLALILLSCKKKETPPDNNPPSNEGSQSESTQNEESSEKEPVILKLLKFELIDSVNQPNTYGSVQGEIKKDTIVVKMAKGIDLTQLIASFKFNGNAVYVDNEKQISGESKNDFSKELTYVVKGKDGKTKSYAVKVIDVSPLPKNQVKLELGGNGYKLGSGTGKISDGGIRNWKSKSVYFMNYIRLGSDGTLKVWLDASARGASSELSVSINDIAHHVKVNTQNDGYPIYAGSWDIHKSEGYVDIKINAVSTTGSYFPNIDNLILGGEATTGENERNVMVRQTNSNSYYWGRRGPSVHLNYTMPDGAGVVRWFYNEVTPKTDPVSLFYMAEGFSGGYFGMQVSSSGTKRFIYSLWSSGSTDDPNEVPEDYRVKVLKAGKNVSTGKFGGEGSGKNAIFNYDWKVGNTYGFLMHVVPNATDGGIYTAYVYIPEEGKWFLIAQFDKPQTSTTSLKGLNSFSENFTPNRGLRERFATFSNQWVYNADGEWKEIVYAQFTGGLTGTRWDQSGGVIDGAFFLRAGGFFDDYVTKTQLFLRPSTGNPPDINFAELPTN